MQFPFLVSFTEPDGATRRYTVRANDVHQAKKRARRQYTGAPTRPRDATADIGRIMCLTPRQDGTLFLPCIDNSPLPVPACASEEEAVAAAERFALDASSR